MDFTLTNTGESTIEYVPTSASHAMDPPVLLTSDGQAISRVQFGTGVSPVGQVTGRRPVGPGESYDGFLLFERPPAEVSAIRLVVPGKRFGTTGLVRVEFPYVFSTPPPPPELTPQVVNAPAPIE